MKELSITRVIVIINLLNFGAVVVAQLVERSLSIPKVLGLNPFIGNIYIYIEHLFTVNCVLKRRI